MADLTKAAAGYVENAGGARKCLGCGMFHDAGWCDLVEGRIRPGGWCRHWVAK